MTQPSKVDRSRLVLYVICVVAVALAFVGIEVLFSLPNPGPDLGGSLSQTQLESIKLTTELCKLQISWSIALIGFVAIILDRRMNSKAPSIQTVEKALAAISLGSAVAAVFFGQLLISSIISNLSHDLFSFRSTSIYLPAMLQYLFILISLSAVILLVLQTSFATKRDTIDEGKK